MELHELHVTQLAPRAPGQRHAIADSPLRIGRLPKELPGTASGEDRAPGPDERLPMRAVPHQGPPAGPLVREQIDGERAGPQRDVIEPPHPFDDRPHHLPAGGVAEGVNDPVVAVPPLSAQLEQAVTLVEFRSPGDQLGDPLRRLADDRIDDRVMAKATTGHECVGHVVVEAIFRIDDPRDPSLRPLARRREEIVLRDDRDRQPGIDSQSRPEPGHATAEDEHVGETVLHPLRTEGDEVPRAIEHLGHSALVP